jgi:hypothetical protein
MSVRTHERVLHDVERFCSTETHVYGMGHHPILIPLDQQPECVPIARPDAGDYGSIRQIGHSLGDQ